MDDDASIYQRREKKTEKQKWKEMNAAQRKQYFLDYYLFPIGVGTAVVLTAVFLLWHFLKPKEETIFYAAVIDEELKEQKTQKLTGELEQLYGADGKYRRVMIDDSFYMKDGAQTKLEVYLHSRQIDVIILEEELYRQFAGYGFFKDIRRILDEEACLKYEEYFLNAAGYRESEDGEVSFEDHETGQGEELPYGVDLSESRRFGEIKKYIKKPVLAVAENAPHPEHAAEFLDYIMEK